MSAHDNYWQEQRSGLTDPSSEEIADDMDEGCEDLLEDERLPLPRNPFEYFSMEMARLGETHEQWLRRLRADGGQ